MWSTIRSPEAIYLGYAINYFIAMAQLKNVCMVIWLYQYVEWVLLKAHFYLIYTIINSCVAPKNISPMSDALLPRGGSLMRAKDIRDIYLFTS